ncbi:sensor histidine kinase [Marisediminicola senii]|uniref:sensor histidine kinase n=1 Tax=Marisediminicola senii TaxID=2711233 RepID=UPI0013EC2337|nr:ATP-binding protein [Marisediminicola senii]
MTPSRPVLATKTSMLLVLVMQCIVVLSCVGVTTLVAVTVQERSIRSATTDRVLDVSRSLADLAQVRAAVQLDAETAMGELQPLADTIERASGVDYVVITDADGIRLTHPTASERGLPVSTDPSKVLAGESFVGTESGTIGSTLRAKVPVFDGGTVVGTASVGILESTIAQDLDDAIGGLLPWVLGSVVLGCLVSALLTGALRRSVRPVEERAREAETQRQIAGALRDHTHEFRTRLHVIRGLVAEGESGAVLEYVDRLVPPTTVMDAASAVTDPALRTLLDAYAAEFADRDGSLEVDPLTTVGAGVLDDTDLLVVSNLCRNAIEAADGRVRVLAVADTTDLHVDVNDDGPGIAPELVDRIFERGVSSKGGPDDRGVGLDIVRREVAHRGGSITVSRSPWGGARFTVEMPLAVRDRAR